MDLKCPRALNMVMYRIKICRGILAVCKWRPYLLAPPLRNQSNSNTDLRRGSLKAITKTTAEWFYKVLRDIVRPE